MGEVRGESGSSSIEVETQEAKKAREEGYHGYKPLCARDLPYNEDVESGGGRDGKVGDVDPGLLRDTAQTSMISVAVAGLLLIAFVIMVAWLVLIALCQVNGFCELIDQSSLTGAASLASVAGLRIPTVFVWGALTVSTLGLAISSVYTVVLLRKPVGTAYMVAVSTQLRECAYELMNQQVRAMLVPVSVLFVLIGLGASWATAGSYLLGAFLSKIAGSTSLSVTSRGNIRTSAASRDGLRDGLRLGFRTGSVVGLTVPSLGLMGLSAAYLMLEDVRVLGAFVAGASTVAFISRITGGIHTNAVSAGARTLKSMPENYARTDGRLAGRFVEAGGNRLGDVSGTGADFFETYVGAIAVTAIVASWLPFFYRDPFALCVFNHLSIDMQCGPFGYPKALSYAIYICRRDALYEDYPTLTSWQSNTAFIAVPFLLASVGILVSALCTTRVHIWVKSVREEGDKIRVLKKLLRSFRVNVVVGAMLVMISSIGICFGLFGPSSAFQRASGMGSQKNLKVFTMDNGADACRAKFRDTGSSKPLPIPSGSVAEGYFRPVSTLGYKFGRASSTPWRLLLCIYIGVGLGLLLEYCSEYFTLHSTRQRKHTETSEEFGAASFLIQGLGTGMLASAIPMFLIAVAILGTHSLYGPYGVGLSAVGMLTLMGIVSASGSCGITVGSAGQIAELAKLPDDVQEVNRALEAVGIFNQATEKGFSTGSAALISVALLYPLVQQSGLVPSARSLVGSPEVASNTLIGSAVAISMSDAYVTIGMLVGVLIPFAFAGLLLVSVSRASNALVASARSQLRDVDAAEKKGDKVALRLASRLLRTTRETAKSAAIEGIQPAALAMLAPLIVGFGLGQKALVGLLIMTVATAFALGTVMANAGEIWSSAEKLAGSDFFPKEYMRLHALKRQDAYAAGRAAGGPLKDGAGPAMNILMKLMAAFGYAAVPLMRPDITRGWIGGAVLGVAALCAVVYAWWNAQRNFKLTDAAFAEDNKPEEVGAPPKRVSPFYGEAHFIDPETAAPGSQLAESLEAAGGNHGVMVDVRTLPGLSARQQPDKNAEIAVQEGTPAGAANHASLSFVLKDSARPVPDEAGVIVEEKE